MIEVEDSVIIRRPVSEVFAFVADQRNAPRWQDGVLEVRRVGDGPLGVGTRHAAVRRFMGRRMELTNERGLLRLAQPIMRAGLRRDFPADSASLKELLEARERPA